MTKLVYGLLALALFSCGEHSSSKPADVLASNDFESVDGWTNGAAQPSLTKEQAHSGVYSVKVDPATEYSLGFYNQLGKLSPSRINKLRIRGWVFVPNDKATVGLVTEVDDPAGGKPLLWDSVDLLKEAREKSAFNKWFELDHTIAIPATSNYNTVLKIYLWRSGSTQPAYLDDLQLSQAD